LRTYETIFILKPTATADEQTKHIDFYKENIRTFGGEIVKEELWGKQQFAYKIDGLSEGIYTLLQFTAEHNYVNTELDKRFKFNEDIVRYVIVMLDGRKFKASPRKESARKPRVEPDKITTKTESSENSVATNSVVGTTITETVTETVVTNDIVVETITTDTVAKTETAVTNDIVAETIATDTVTETVVISDTKEDTVKTDLGDETSSTDKK